MMQDVGMAMVYGLFYDWNENENENERNEKKRKERRESHVHGQFKEASPQKRWN